MSAMAMRWAASRALRLAVGFVLFQAAWFVCVLGAARGTPGLGIGAVAAVVGVLLAWSTDRRADVRLLLLALVVGALWDGLLARSGVAVYASPQPQLGTAPAWILAMWALLAPMLREPMRWLHGRPWLAALFGGVGGPLSYAAAQRLGACEFPDPTVAWLALAAGWAVITPLLLAAAQHLDRRRIPTHHVATPRKDPA